ncbi:MAG: glycosyltransferase family 2 protein [Candidatus Gottesmanbacteria bacterium]|nr:glycosyltransferase family 2 protein [Candidatus Gottesmanbacteria bacterium]
MENKTKVAVIIVNWNGHKDTEICLSSLEKIEKHDVELRVIVVDNGSSDDSIASIRKKYPGVTVIPTGKNLGFTGGNNVGITYARQHRADFVWLLNNDTFVDSHVLSVLRAFRDSKVGICGSKIYFAPGHEFHSDRYKETERGKIFWYAGGLVDWDNMYASHRGVDEVDHGQYNTEEETPFVTGCSMMIRADVFDRIGELDDRYYLYLEDLDFCLRAKKAGFSLRYVPSSVLWHVNASSSARPGNPLQQYYQTRNRMLLGFRFAQTRTKIALLREAIRYLLTGSSVRRKAVIDFFSGRYGNRFSL